MPLFLVWLAQKAGPGWQRALNRTEKPSQLSPLAEFVSSRTDLDRESGWRSYLRENRHRGASASRAVTLADWDKRGAWRGEWLWRRVLRGFQRALCAAAPVRLNFPADDTSSSRRRGRIVRIQGAARTHRAAHGCRPSGEWGEAGGRRNKCDWADE